MYIVRVARRAAGAARNFVCLDSPCRELEYHNADRASGGWKRFLAQDTRVWKEISRVFALSFAARPGDVCVDFRVEGLGNLTLSSIEGTSPSHLSELAELTVLQTVNPPGTVCGLNLTTRTTMPWST